VLEYALPGFKHQVQAVESAITFLKAVYGAQRLQVVLEPAIVPHAFVEGVLPGMAERCVAEIVRESHGFGKVVVDSQRPRDGSCQLGHFDGMRQAGAEEVAFMIDENLGLVFQPSKRGRVDDPVPVALELAARLRRGFNETPPPAIGLADGVWRKLSHRSTPR